MQKPTLALALLFSGSLLLGVTAYGQLTQPNVDPKEPAGNTVTQRVDTVDVTATQGHNWKSYRSMVEGLTAFEKHRNTYAPTASLRFVVIPNNAATPMNTLGLAIVGKEMAIDIALDADGAFQLPLDQRALDEDADIVINRKQGLFSFRALVVSPGAASTNTSTSADTPRRLGDLRLSCEVGSAISKAHGSLASRAFFAVIGSLCTSPRNYLSVAAPNGLTGVVFQSSDRREQISAIKKLPSGKVELRLPLHDQRWPNDTKVTFEFGASIGESKPEKLVGALSEKVE